MTTRGRSRTYTDRLHQRMAAPRRTRRLPAWLPLRTAGAVVVGCAEVGHLAAAMMEWPGSVPRGVFHVLAAAALGVLASSVYFGRSRVELALGVALTVFLPVAWLAGALLGMSPYRHHPDLAAAAAAALEVTVAGLLTMLWRQSR